LRETADSFGLGFAFADFADISAFGEAEEMLAVRLVQA
jgi:hypothetical protein